MWQFVPVIYIIIGFILFFIVALRPKYFWQFLLAITVGAAGLIMMPRTTYSICLVDEYLTACIVLGVLLAMSVGAVHFKKNRENIGDQLHKWLFFFLVSYMFFQSIRGFLLWQDITLIRWVIYYLVLGMVAFIISKTDLPVPSMKKTLLTILWSALAFFTSYLAFGVYSEYVRGLPYYRLDVQGTEMSGPGYAVFPLVIAIPAAIFVLKYYLFKEKLLAWAIIVLTLITGYYYDARSAFMGVMLFLFVSPTVVKLKQIILLFLIFSGLVFLYHQTDLQLFLDQILKSMSFGYSGDSGRWVTIKASVNAVSESLSTFLFGYGIHSHHFILGQYMQEAGHSFPKGVPSYVRVTGFGSLLTDIGAVGVSLFAFNFLIVARKILFQKNNPNRIILLVALFLPIFWLLFSKIEDIVLLWFMIMPAGLLSQMAGYKERNKIAKTIK